MNGAGPVVVKLGGSLMDGAGLDPALDAVLAADRPVAIVCGGGLFGDAVRAAQARLGFSDPLAHRLALDSMSHFAEILAERRPALALADAPDAVRGRLAEGRKALWHPAVLRSGHPDIPESWAVTSDSLALWLAARIGAAAVLVVKSAEPDPTPPALRRLVAADYLDAAFPAFLAGYSGIVRILGPADHGRLAPAIADPTAPVGLAIERERED